MDVTTKERESISTILQTKWKGMSYYEVETCHKRYNVVTDEGYEDESHVIEI